MKLNKYYAYHSSGGRNPVYPYILLKSPIQSTTISSLVFFIDSTRYGLPGAFQSYVRINERRANRQRELLESNFAGGKEKSELAKNVENTLLTLLFEFVVTPVETVATMVGQGKQMQTFNQSLGAADWGGNNKKGGGGGNDPGEDSVSTMYREGGRFPDGTTPQHVVGGKY